LDYEKEAALIGGISVVVGSKQLYPAPAPGAHAPPRLSQSQGTRALAASSSLASASSSSSSASLAAAATPSAEKGEGGSRGGDGGEDSYAKQSKFALLSVKLPVDSWGQHGPASPSGGSMMDGGLGSPLPADHAPQQQEQEQEHGQQQQQHHLQEQPLPPPGHPLLSLTVESVGEGAEEGEGEGGDVSPLGSSRSSLSSSRSSAYLSTARSSLASPQALPPPPPPPPLPNVSALEQRLHSEQLQVRRCVRLIFLF
jgi:hypothetical protein